MKKNILIFMAVMLCMATFGFAAVSTTISSPAAGGTASGVQVITATVAGQTGSGQNATNASFYYKLSTDSTYTFVGVNESNNLTSYTMGWATSALRDDLTYDIRVIIANESAAQLAIDTNLDLLIDNGNPTCSQTTLVSSGSYDPDTTTSVSVTGANGTSATVTFDSNTYTLSEVSDVFTFDLTQVPESVYSTVQFSVTDGLDTTQCTALTNIEIDNPSGRNTQNVAAAQAAQKDNGGPNMRIVLVVFIAIVAIMIYDSNKKR
ncbi:MAG: hypothetical protein U9O94_08440 [Nanoarchaeota archaeon]|nr:hypothetical protein [Nanoarchaeota archaeon]